MILIPDSWGSLAETGDHQSIHTDKFHRCVGHVEGSVDNAYAVCQASLGRNAIKGEHRRRKRYYRTRHPKKVKEFNPCHDPKDGRFASKGSCSDGSIDPPAVGPRIGFASPDGDDHVARKSSSSWGREDHTDMARRLLGMGRGNIEIGSVRTLLQRGYVRYWVRHGEVNLNFISGNKDAANRALSFIKDNFQKGDRIYLDIENPSKGLQFDGTYARTRFVQDFSGFFDNPREANERIRRAGGL